MILQQISIFLENKSGRLAEVTDLLGRAGVNIRALTLADTADFGILRLIVDDNERAEKTLRENGFTVGKTDVVAIEVPDHPGGLARVLAELGKAGINVEYMYAFVAKSGGNAVVIFRFDEPRNAIGLLTQAGIRVLRGEEIYNL
jgi:hypothetical protein